MLLLRSQTSKTTLRDENWLSKVCLEQQRYTSGDASVTKIQFPVSSPHQPSIFSAENTNDSLTEEDFFMKNVADFGGSIASMGPDTYFY